MSEDFEGRTRKDRSPSYPSIGLEVAIQRVRAVWEKERRHAVSVDSIYRDLGYSGRTGPALTTLAALRKYGLLQNEGPGLVKLSDLAVTILLAPGDDHPDRLRAIREAAFRPTIFAALRDKYGAEPPSDDAIRYYLVRDLGFTEAAAEITIRRYRETLAFAGIGSSDNITVDPIDAPDEEVDEIDTTQILRKQRTELAGRPTVDPTQTIRFPLSEDVWVTLQVRLPLTEEAWAQLMATLPAFKNAMVKKPGPPSPQEGDPEAASS